MDYDLPVSNSFIWVQMMHIIGVHHQLAIIDKNKCSAFCDNLFVHLIGVVNEENKWLSRHEVNASKKKNWTNLSVLGLLDAYYLNCGILYFCCFQSEFPFNISKVNLAFVNLIVPPPPYPGPTSIVSKISNQYLVLIRWIPFVGESYILTKKSQMQIFRSAVWFFFRAIAK